MENTGNKQNKENKYKRGKAQRRDWYQLDLSAIVYPTLQRRDFSSVYRLSVLLKEEVRPDVLCGVILRCDLITQLTQSRLIHRHGASSFDGINITKEKELVMTEI